LARLAELEPLLLLEVEGLMRKIVEVVADVCRDSGIEPGTIEIKDGPVGEMIKAAREAAEARGYLRFDEEMQAAAWLRRRALAAGVNLAALCQRTTGDGADDVDDVLDRALRMIAAAVAQSGRPQ